MSTYGQYCPVSQAISVFGERWTPLVIRELLMGSHRFNDIRRGVPLMSPTLLAQRLRTLEAAGIVETRSVERVREYHLTEAGEEFRSIVEALGAWGVRWSRTEHEIERDPSLLMWDVHRRLALDRFPPGRTVLLFNYPDAPKGKRTYWLAVDGDEVDVCLADPGYPVDLRITARVQSMVDVWAGNLRIADAIRNEQIVLEGPRKLQQAFPSWLLLSIFADVPRPDPARRTRAAASG
jgi:DNA-binding HxlR family transcriptional regulator